MKSNILSLHPDTFYHIYNRGVNGENIFKDGDNYAYFLSKYGKFILPIADTYVYCLLKNHFHILIKTKSEIEIQENYCKEKPKNCSEIISLQFSHFFNGYAQAINKKYNRTGSLFETPFRRIEITDENHLRYLVFYIHFNAEKHGLSNDFKRYLFSSYLTILSDKRTNLKRKDVLNWFGDKEGFLSFHDDMRNTNRVQFTSEF